MIKQTLGFILLSTLLSISTIYAMPPFVGDDYSGQYVCKGSNASVGDYEVLLTLKLNKITSHDIYGIYDFSTEANNHAAYIGQIMATGRQFAMTFKLLGSKASSFSTGMGDFKKSRQQWAFYNTYYEPDGSGGNFGSDYCKMKDPVKTNLKKPTNKSSK